MNANSLTTSNLLDFKQAVDSNSKADQTALTLFVPALMATTSNVNEWKQVMRINGFSKAYVMQEIGKPLLLYIDDPAKSGS